jgi:hypothetical protein
MDGALVGAMSHNLIKLPFKTTKKPSIHERFQFYYHTTFHFCKIKDFRMSSFM